MSDPFEAPPAPFPTSTSTIRESSVQQAVTFLNDPRVKSADPSAALDFLRKKGATEEELREAYRRCGLPFPSAPPTASLPQPLPPQLAAPFPHPHPHLVPFHPPPQRGPSWVSVFLGVAAAAGIYTAFREVLKRYVVPMYFPEAARIAEERRRQDQMATQQQDLQIADLRQQVRELAESSRKTNETVDQLALSVRSMVDGPSPLHWPPLTGTAGERAQDFSQSSELRNAIRPLSHSVSASGGTSTSRVPSDAVGERSSDAGYRRLLEGKHADKQGSLSYTYVDQYTGSVERFSQVEETSEAGTPGTRVVLEGTGARGVEVVDVPNVDKNMGGNDSEDEFMAIKPAEVEESWGAGLAKVDGGGAVGAASGVQNAALASQSSVGVPQTSKAEVRPGRAEEERESSVEVESVTREDQRIDAVGSRDDDTFGGTVTQAARQLFQTELMNEAKYVFDRGAHGFGGPSEVERNLDRGRPLSMPAMEPPLSDND